MKVLLSAYACTPGTGSEPGVGFATLEAIAEHHEVWVLTRLKNVEPLRAFFRDHPFASRVNVVGLDLSPRAIRIKKRFGEAGLQWYYDRWQVEAKRIGADLAEEVSFDLTHHVTFASDWARAGIAALALPLVWGPVGGGVVTPLSLMPTLGLRGAGEEAARVVARALMRRRRWYQEAWRHAAVVLVQNRETAALGRDSVKSLVLPNSTALLTDPPAVTGSRNKEILVVGRLLPWKGGRLALRALEYVTDPEAVLVFVGEGRAMTGLRAMAHRRGMTGRVRFEGPLPRQAVLERMARAGALLHPALHDESPVTIGEALSLGTPVVCLDRGGPPELLRRWADSPGAAVTAGTPRRTARLLGEEVNRFLSEPPPVVATAYRPTPSYAQSLLSAYELAAKGGSE
ncbi:MAG TPA: glycosyltransferase [Acidimicrobiia bacterium]|nr:glycosyltransferase [Acidimicrobiia bacterium]